MTRGTCLGQSTRIQKPLNHSVLHQCPTGPADPSAEVSAVVIMAFRYERDWLSDPRKRDVLVKAWSIVRGTEYENILKHIKVGDDDE